MYDGAWVVASAGERGRVNCQGGSVQRTSRGWANVRGAMFALLLGPAVFVCTMTAVDLRVASAQVQPTPSPIQSVTQADLAQVRQEVTAIREQIQDLGAEVTQLSGRSTLAIVLAIVAAGVVAVSIARARRGGGSRLRETGTLEPTPTAIGQGSGQGGLETYELQGSMASLSQRVADLEAQIASPAKLVAPHVTEHVTQVERPSAPTPKSVVDRGEIDGADMDDVAALDALVRIYQQMRGTSHNLFVPLPAVLDNLILAGLAPSPEDASRLVDRLAQSFPKAVRLGSDRGEQSRQLAIYHEYVPETST
jgi:cell division protein FtsB